MSAVEVPSFLNVDYIAKALTKAYATKVKLLKCDIKRASANGENFCSDIYRVHVRFSCSGSGTQEKSLVLKVMIPEIAEVGTNECAMYETVLPVMEQLMAQKDAGRSVRFSPNCLMIDRDGREIYVLEDLNAVGYSLADRWLGLDLVHAELLMRKLGQFHAASMVFIAKFPNIVQSLKPAHFSKGAEDALANAITFGGMAHARKIVSKWQNFEGIATKMQVIAERFNEHIKALVDPDTSSVRVLTHGDLWINNFLFSYEQDLPQEVLFVDFQNCCLGSPGWDIHYFLNTSVKLEVLETKRSHLLRVYFKSLQSSLKWSGYDPEKMPSRQTIVEEIRRTEFFGYYAVVCELPICCISKQASQDMTVNSFENAEEMAHKRTQMYEECPRVLEMLRYSIQRFDELGVLDF